MKQFIVYFFTLVISITAKAAPGPSPIPATANAAAAAKVLVNSGAVRFQFNKIVTTQDHADSVLVIFDRCDHTGAGVIYQLYAADTQQGIDISGVPAGKYFVTIKFRGIHRDEIEKVITIKSQKSENVRIELGDTEVFARDNVRIPAFRPDFSDLTTK